MRTCSIPYCNNKHEAHGYCRRHYRSYKKYGDALHIDNEKIKQAEKNGKEVDLTYKRPIRRGKCSVRGCDTLVKAKNLCEKHYTRLRYNGTTNLTRLPNEIVVDECLAFDCDRATKRHGLCEYHLSFARRNKTVYKPKILKLCGIEECVEIHYKNGLCELHYEEWGAVVKHYSLNQYVPLKQ